ncbi:MAG: PilZ domain-containing protein [Phycisphaerae bacterium]
MTTLEQERRCSRRYQLDWPVTLWHEPTKRFYDARSVNISVSGALIQLPLTVPIRKSEDIEVKFTLPKDNEADGQNASNVNVYVKAFSASVVRINRGQSILQAHQSVALTFKQNQ